MGDFLIYCDLDGVLVDLFGRMSQIYRKKLNNNNFSEEFFAYIDKLDTKEKINFWRDLDQTDECAEIWNFIKIFNPYILTACSGMSTACVGKKRWCAKNLNISPKYVICASESSDKQHYSGKNKILIDDLESNVNEWEQKGGIGILHKNSKNTIKLLKNLLYTKYDTYDI